VPDEIADAYERRDLSPEAHRHAYTALARTVSEEHADAVYAQVEKPETWVPYPDALGVVAELERRGIKTGVVSNAGFDIRRILRHHGFTDLADRTTVSHEVGVMKPDPKIFRAALEMLGTRAEETLMVGDNAEADGGATAVGMEFLHLPMRPPGETQGLAEVLTRLREPEPGEAAAEGRS
jgi:HAD superfamily hydrolase (TIGR01549 family)